MQFQIIMIETTPAVAECTMVTRTSKLSILDTLPVEGNVSNEDKLNGKAAYLTKTAIQEGLDEEVQELEDIKAWGIQEVAEESEAARLSVEKVKKALETQMHVIQTQQHKLIEQVHLLIEKQCVDNK